jgi:exosortase/archaeosortase family protein
MTSVSFRPRPDGQSRRPVVPVPRTPEPAEELVWRDAPAASRHQVVRPRRPRRARPEHRPARAGGLVGWLPAAGRRRRAVGTARPRSGGRRLVSARVEARPADPGTPTTPAPPLAHGRRAFPGAVTSPRSVGSDVTAPWKRGTPRGRRRDARPAATVAVTAAVAGVAVAAGRLTAATSHRLAASARRRLASAALGRPEPAVAFSGRAAPGILLHRATTAGRRALTRGHAVTSYPLGGHNVTACPAPPGRPAPASRRRRAAPAPSAAAALAGVPGRLVRAALESRHPASTAQPPRHRRPAEHPVAAALRRPVTRLYLALGVTWLAFASGLVSLASGIRFADATGELVVVPVVVTVLLHVVIARHEGLRSGRLRPADYAGVLFAVILVAAVVAGRPADELNDAALRRLDLLVLPLVLAAVLVLVLGLRVLVVGAFPLLFAFLTWPYPWTLLEANTIGALARATYGAATWLTGLAGVAEPVRESGDAVLRVGDGAAAFEISVAPACSGFTGIVAYLLLGGGALFLLRGTAARRAAWLATGLVAVWLGTLVRVLLLAATGARWGPDVALQVLHPYAGLTLDVLVFLAMLRLAGTFGLRPAARLAPPEADGAALPPASQVLARLGVVLLVAVTVTVVDRAGAFGAPPPAAVHGVHRQTTLGALRATDPAAAFVGPQRWSRTFFGADSSWNRYRLRSAVPVMGPGVPGGPGGRHRPTVWLDSITVTTAAALDAHPVLECYTFHRGQVLASSPHRLAGGILAEAIVVRRPGGDVWYSLHWQWPVSSAGALRYERVVLMTAQPRRTRAVRGPGGTGGHRVVVDDRVITGLARTADRLLATPSR